MSPNVYESSSATVDSIRFLIERDDLVCYDRTL